MKGERVMANYCKECAHLDINGGCQWGNEYYCEVTLKYTPENKTACDAFVKRAPGGYHKAGCYITTICCQMLGYPDNCEVLTLMRSLREDYLKTTSEGIRILQEYDQIGPMISANLAQENISVAIELLRTFLIPSAKATKEKQYKRATATYLNMFAELKERYGLMDIAVDYSLDTPMEILGKGRKRISSQLEKPVNNI